MKLAAHLVIHHLVSQTGIEPFASQAESRLEALMQKLPHGSGIDSEWTIDENSNKKKLSISNSYHVMNDNGYYEGWIDFTVVVVPTLLGITTTIKGRFGKRLDIREYLEELLSTELNTEV